MPAHVSGVSGPNGTTIDHFRVELHGLTCAEARAVDKKYGEQPVTQSNGNIDFQQFDGWSCYAPTATSAMVSDNYETCTKGTTSFRFRAP